MSIIELITIHPPLPWDVFILILREMDLSTLAAFGRVSFDFFLASTPILYRDIEVDSFERLKQLFQARDQTTSLSRIYPHLSLFQTRTLSINFTSLEDAPLSEAGGPQLSLSFSRLASTSRSNDPILPVDTLRLSVNHRQKHLVIPLYGILFPRLDPTHFEYIVTARELDKGIWTTLPHDQTPILAQWRRLSTLSFIGGIPIRDPGEPPFGTVRPLKPKLLASLRAPKIERRREVRMDVASLLNSKLYPTVARFMKLFVVNEGVLGLNGMQLESIVLVVKTEEERVELEAGVEKLAMEKWKKLFVVEVGE